MRQFKLTMIIGVDEGLAKGRSSQELMRQVEYQAENYFDRLCLDDTSAYVSDTNIEDISEEQYNE